MLDSAQPKKPHRDDPRFLSSVERGFAVIECLAGAVGPRSLTELSQATGLTIPTLQRLTSALLEAGYVEKAGSSKRYRLTIRALDLLYYFLSRNGFAKIAWPHMVRLRELVQLDVALALPLGHTMIYLHRLPGHRGSYESTLPGKRSPLHASASGLCILAALSEAGLETYLDVAAPPEDHKTLRDAVSLCQERGYGLVQEAGPLGQITLACPVVHSGSVIAGVSVQAPTTLTAANDLIAQTLPDIRKAAVNLSS
ncbi:MAG: IclR family transcriptional regulator [Litoreibacter sp.]|nr:IclR family transcriptional regulator [Litoreibacter sp.]